jgi:energy-coupling factor transport system substrate-specific component
MIGDNTRKLTMRDQVNCGIFIALFFVFHTLGGILFAPNPVLTFLMPASIALLTGPVYLLLVAKVPKHGPIIILGIIMAFVMFIMGMYWLWSVSYLIFAVIADRVAGVRHFRSKAFNTASFVIFSLNPLGAYIMLWVNPAIYFSYLMEKGTPQKYVDVMSATAQWWMLPAMAASITLCALLSATLGHSLLRRQFQKAGIAQ